MWSYANTWTLYKLKKSSLLGTLYTRFTYWTWGVPFVQRFSSDQASQRPQRHERARCHGFTTGKSDAMRIARLRRPHMAGKAGKSPIFHDQKKGCQWMGSHCHFAIARWDSRKFNWTKPCEPYGKFALLKRHALYMIRAISSAARVGLSRKLLWDMIYWYGGFLSHRGYSQIIQVIRPWLGIGTYGDLGNLSLRSPQIITDVVVVDWTL